MAGIKRCHRLPLVTGNSARGRRSLFEDRGNGGIGVLRRRAGHGGEHGSGRQNYSEWHLMMRRSIKLSLRI
jgi:hypothetical protein